ncbi:hypothetical protein EYF80_044425 [Liparis tanakae]|uniref:Uncharacterized protein n=1 Tax=Liparis tanakae TaxID=230148 RepID=A0A4Z2FWV2_9TELE|nr:hypothetical protein EYF80_044425 [Liparis tanakae]
MSSHVSTQKTSESVSLAVIAMRREKCSEGNNALQLNNPLPLVTVGAAGMSLAGRRPPKLLAL